MITILRPQRGSLGLCLVAILPARDVCVRTVNETIKHFVRPEILNGLCVLFAGLVSQSPLQSRSCPTCRYPLPGDQTTCFPRNFALEDAIAHLNEQVRPLSLIFKVLNACPASLITHYQYGIANFKQYFVCKEHTRLCCLHL